MGLDLRSLVHRTEKPTDPAVVTSLSTDPPASPVPGAHVASTLRKARARRGLTLEQAAAETRISRQYLEAFEGPNEPDRLPPLPYRRYFLREYARYLGVAEDSVADPVPAPQIPAPIVPELKPLMGPKPRRWPVRGLVVVSVLALIALGVVRVVTHRSGSLVPQVPPAAASPGPGPSIAGGHGQSRSPAGAANAVRAVVAVSVPSWVEALADGRVVWQGTLPAGRSLKVTAKTNLQLVFGNAGGVRLQVNGKRVPTGGFGQVMRLTFAVKNGRVVTSSAVR
jgi:cytoskeleton protein RodZ